jgi:hypothetical protein
MPMDDTGGADTSTESVDDTTDAVQSTDETVQNAAADGEVEAEAKS